MLCIAENKIKKINYKHKKQCALNKQYSLKYKDTLKFWKIHFSSSDILNKFTFSFIYTDVETLVTSTKQPKNYFNLLKNSVVQLSFVLFS